ncbi:MAG TPA: STAS domain-containing protein [Candidatus Eisenbacteria bacterium]|jgi:anti-anti-sigma factor
MVAQTGSPESRTSVAMNLQFTRGRHGAAARLEVHERPAGRVGLLALRGWVDLSAERGIERALDDLATRGLARLVVDCSQLLHVDYRLVPRLADALVRIEAHAGAVVLCGLSRYLRDLFRIAGCESKLCSWPNASDLLDAAPDAAGRERERAS